MKVKVKMNESIAGLADARPKDELDQKYRDHIQSVNESRRKSVGREMSRGLEDQIINSLKKADRYGEKPIGFAKDWTFKPGDEAMIESDLAEKWQASGVCTIVEQNKKAV